MKHLHITLKQAYIFWEFMPPMYMDSSCVYHKECQVHPAKNTPQIRALPLASSACLPRRLQFAYFKCISQPGLPEPSVTDGGDLNKKNLFCDNSGGPSSTCQQVWFFLRPLLLVCRGPASHVSVCGLFSECAHPSLASVSLLMKED